jgi:hypothetical protein
MASVTSCCSRRTKELGEAAARAAREEMVMVEKRMLMVLGGGFGKIGGGSEGVDVRRCWSLMGTYFGVLTMVFIDLSRSYKNDYPSVRHHFTGQLTMH